MVDVNNQLVVLNNKPYSVLENIHGPKNGPKSGYVFLSDFDTLHQVFAHYSVMHLILIL
jgi:hypothetical protein